MKTGFKVLFVLLLVVQTTVRAEGDAGLEPPKTMPDVVVLGEDPGQTDNAVLSTRDLSRSPPADGGDLLRAVNGVSAGRMGGRGLDPSIRGQAQGRINVLLDGAYIFGACPNRMDPPTSFAVVDAWDRVTVIKGVQTLLWGGGGTGGTVNFERDLWPTTPGMTGSAGLASSTNGTEQLVFGNLGVGADDYFGRVRAQTVKAGNYRDGSGANIRSGYEEKAATLETGLTLRDSHRIEFTADLTRGSDLHYAGAGMDAPKDDSDAFRMRYEANVSGAAVEFSGWYGKVHHDMDNYTVRPLTAPMAMRVPARTATAGGRLLLKMPAGVDRSLTLGMDYLDTRRHATRFQGIETDDVNTVNSYLWPGTDIRRAGLVVEGTGRTGNGAMTAALRYDYGEAGAGAADKAPALPMLMSADQLYLSYYGTEDTSDHAGGVSALVRYRHAFGDGGPVVYAGISRTLRMADATERFIAANSPMDPSNRWVGNPSLDPEVHRQADIGFDWQRSTWRLGAAIYYDDVNDYITPDRAHGQPGILRDDGARIYRNVAAEIYGAEIDGIIDLGDSWRLEASAAIVHGENTDDTRPLPQIAPLNGRVTVTRFWPNGNAGIRLRWADRQSRVDDDPASGSGLDPGETPGHGVVDTFIRLRDPRLGEIGVGIDNLFDRTWADHLNRANQDPFDPGPLQVNEPGRVVWANWRRDF